MTRPLVVKVTCGADDAERCNQGFTVAATAVAAGAEVSLWLTGEAAWFGVPGRAEAFSLERVDPAGRPAGRRPGGRSGHRLLAVRGPALADRGRPDRRRADRRRGGVHRGGARATMCRPLSTERRRRRVDVRRRCLDAGEHDPLDEASSLRLKNHGARRRHAVAGRRGRVRLRARRRGRPGRRPGGARRRARPVAGRDSPRRRRRR